MKSEEGVLYAQLLLFNHSVISDSLRRYGVQHARLPCPSLPSWSGSNSCPLSQWCHSTISPSGIPFSSCLQSLPASGSFHESVLHIRWPKYWSFNFSISPSNEYSGLVSSRIDWFDLLADQGALKSLPQRYNWKASVLQCSAFFMVQLSHPYMTTEKTIALTRQTLVDKMISLLFNMLSRIVIAFLPRRNLLILWLQSLSSVILEPKKIKSITVYILYSSICHEVMGPDAMILLLCMLSFKPGCFFFFFLICTEIQPVHPKGISPGRTDAEAETPILWPPHAKSWLIGKDPDAGRDWGQEEKGTTEDEMAGWHHRLDAHEFGWIPGVGDGQGGLECCDSQGRKESDTTERLNWTELNANVILK